MNDLIKAVLLGAVLIAGFLLIPAILAVLIPVGAFAIIVIVIWVLIKAFSAHHDDP